MYDNFFQKVMFGVTKADGSQRQSHEHINTYTHHASAIVRHNFYRFISIDFNQFSLENHISKGETMTNNQQINVRTD